MVGERLRVQFVKNGVDPAGYGVRVEDAIALWLKKQPYQVDFRGA